MARRGRTGKIVAGCLILAGVAVLLVTGYKVWDPFAGAREQAAQEALTRSWGSLPALPGPAEATGKPTATAKPTATSLCVIPRTGSRSHRNIPYDRDFIILTLPSTRKGTATITAGRGMKINHVY